MQKTQATREGGELVTDRVMGLLQPWWAVSWHLRNRTVSGASVNKDVTQLSLLPVPLGMSGGWLEPTGCSCGPAPDGDCVAVLA